MKGQRGITLIALIITVIVMLILAGVAITAVAGTDGLFTKSQTAADTYQTKVNEETKLVQQLINAFNNHVD